MKKQQIKSKILIPIIVVIVLLLVISVFSIYYIQDKSYSEDIYEHIHETKDIFNGLIMSESKMLAVHINYLLKDSIIGKTYENKNRDKLYKYCLPIFNEMKQKHKVTHFYFIDTTGQCFLRVHNKLKYNDTIKRDIFKKANRIKKSASGIELGVFGTLTLRYVSPIMDDNEIIGYLELGMEIGQIMPDVKKMAGVDFVLLIDKSYLTKERWEVGLKMSGKNGNWNELDDFVIAGKTINYTLEFNNLINSKQLVPTSIKNKFYKTGVIPIIDSSNSKLGKLIIFEDISSQHKIMYKLLLFLIIISIVVGAVLVLFFSKYISRIENKIIATYNKLNKAKKQSEYNKQEIQNKRDEYFALNEEYKTINEELVIVKEKTEKSEVKLKQAQKIAHLGYWQLDFVENKLYWSDEIYRIFDLKPQEFGATYEAFLNNIHPDDRDKVNKAYTNSLKDKIPYEIEHRLLLKTGELKYVIEKCNTEFDNNGKPIRSMGTVLDITTLKKTEQNLLIAKERIRESEIHYHQLFNLLPYGGEVINLKGIVLDCSQSTSNMLGYSKKEIVGKHITHFISSDSLGIFKTNFPTLVKGGSILVEVNMVHKNGNKLVILRAAQAIFDKNKEVKNILALNVDITDRKKIENELIIAKEKAEESNRLKTEFINNMSHEIRTPMNGILGFSSFLNNGNLSEVKKKQYISIIQNSGNQLMRIIDDILEISQLGTKQVKIIETEVCLNDLLLEQFSIFDIKAKEKNISLYLKKGLPDKDCTILSDETKLNKILSNLLENALKFTNEGFVEFGYKIKNEDIEIYVKDTGVGIKYENQKTIFNRFSQEEKQLSKNVGGLGLGLSIAKESADLLGGEITLESEKGKGATFYLKIPYKSAKLAVKKNNANNTVSLKNGETEMFTILIVEDEEINCLYLYALLERLGENLKTIHAKNGKEAVDICKNNPNINIILMDLKMPIMNGIEATKQIRKFLKKTPIVAQTAYSTQEERGHALNAGCDDFISKPISEATLSKIINKYLRDKREL